MLYQCCITEFHQEGNLCICELQCSFYYPPSYITGVCSWILTQFGSPWPGNHFCLVLTMDKILFHNTLTAAVVKGGVVTVTGQGTHERQVGRRMLERGIKCTVSGVVG